ncbi:NAD(P)/FAD-dependent oxidoreductase [Robiginitomaculum antarcticum]|uniref:NAD(P)/FAD-dependent oxidoreductase n=1 Tax=Robiginitomaculum antarcticum TaxID=437507 RepID=UPI0003760D06|nr:FAD-dependent oxidoreductase [Robiginitomaculum antarcticum]
MEKLAIIGAGIAGLRAAQLLAPYGNVSVFEKSRGVAGRMSTRYSGDYEFDHGAQYFTVKTNAFADFLSPYVISGQVTSWSPKALPESKSLKYIATPRMNSLCKAMAKPLDITLDTQVASAKYDGGGWTLTDADGANLGIFDALIVAVPSAQARNILSDDVPQAIEALSHIANFTLMVGLSGMWSGAWDAIRPDSDVIGWAAVNSAKPGRNIDHTSLVIQSRNDWAEQHKDADRDWVRAQMTAAFKGMTGLDVSTAKILMLHRWRYANVYTSLRKDIYADPKRNLIIAGDGCLGGRVESAWQSGNAAGLTVKGWMSK